VADVLSDVLMCDCKVVVDLKHFVFRREMLLLREAAAIFRASQPGSNVAESEILL